MVHAITSVHVFYTLDPRGNERMLMFASSTGRMPMLCYDERNLKYFRDMAQLEARRQGREVVMKRFEGGTIAEVITP